MARAGVKILVTGATGFIGARCCAALLARGDSVVACSQSGGDWRPGEPSVAIPLEAPIDPALLRDVDAVIHAAGIAHRRASADLYDQVNHVATRALARAAADAGVRHFVFLSSVKAMGAPRSDAPRGESELSTPTDPYGLSKWRAERALREDHAGGSMAVTILRPSLVYGAGVGGNLGSLARAVRRGLPRPPTGGARSMVSGADLVKLLLRGLDDRPAGVNTWIVADGEEYSTRRIYDALRAGQGWAMGRQWLPRWAWRLGLATLDRVQGNPDSSADKLFGIERYSNAALCAETGWRPALRFEDEAAAIMQEAPGG